MDEKKMNLLVRTLLDKDASISERDDAAMDLFEYDNDFVLNALIKIAKNKEADPIVRNSCGESIASIWVKRNTFDKNTYEMLSKEAQDGMYFAIRADRPDWLKFLL